MDEHDDNLNTFLAYTKSPKTAKRTSFQVELKKAVNARVSRQQALEESEHSDYSDEFESDDSLDKSLKTKTINFKFSDEEEDSDKKVTFLKSKKQPENNTKEPDDGVEADISKEYNQHKSSFSGEDKKEHPISDNNETKPAPKPRKTRMKHSLSSPGFGISVSDGSFKPIPQQRTFPRESSYLEDTDSDQVEGKHGNKKSNSLSAPSSLTRISDKVPASEISSPEGHQLIDLPVSPTRAKSPLMPADGNNTTVSKDISLLKALQIKEADGDGNIDLSGSGRQSPSVMDMMLLNVKEKSIPQDNKDPLVKMSEKHGQEHDHQKNLEASLELGRSQSSRAFSSPQTKTKSSKSSTQISAKSRYLGTLTVLDKSVNESHSEAADKLRAAVYQNWLEKKKVYLQELYKLKKAKEEEERDKANQGSTSKKEEAMAAFMAWKAEKKKDLKEKVTKQKMEEQKKREEIQELSVKKEECRRAFEKWKEAKEEYLKQNALNEKKTEVKKKKKEEEAILEKTQSSMYAFKKWNEQKHHVLKQKKKEEIYEKLKLEKIKAEKEDKEKRALEMYDQWLEKKERQEKIERKQNRLRFILDDDPPPPWSPPGKTIPAGR